MTIKQYLSNKQVSQTTEKLIEKLKIYWESDEDFVLGVLYNLKTDEEKQILINYIEQGKDVSYENIILYALDIKLS